MKNLQIILVLAISFMSCKTPNITVVEAQLNQGLETGKCYFSIIQNNNHKKEKGFVLELVSPKYEDTEIKYTDEQLKNYAIGNEEYRLPVREAHAKFVLRNESLPRFTTVRNPIGFLYCIVEVPPEFKIFSKEDLLRMDKTVIHRKVASKSKIIKKYVKKRPDKLLENQFYFERGSWSELQEAIGSSHDGMGNQLVLNVKRKLIEIGYELTEDNDFDKATKEALIDFQRKNNLQEGQLDIKTLKKLGIKN